MPRIARGLAAGYIYHVLNRGNGKQRIFHKKGDYKAFIELMIEAKNNYSIKIFGYCLMPNHFHLVVMPLQAEELSRYMQWLMTSHVRRYHSHYGSSGHVWQGRFKSFIVQEEDYFLTVMKYVEGNPLRSGFVKLAKDWLWSSHKESINEKPRFFTDNPPLELPKNWENCVNEPLEEMRLLELRQSIDRGAPYGAPFWQEKISGELGLKSTLRARGRPKKKMAE